MPALRPLPGRTSRSYFVGMEPSRLTSLQLPPLRRASHKPTRPSTFVSDTISCLDPRVEVYCYVCVSQACASARIRSDASV